MKKIHGGFILLARAIEESSSWQALNEAGKVIMITLLMLANHKEQKWYNPFTKQIATIQRGQAIIGRKSLAKRANVGEQSVRTTLNVLRTTNFLTIQPTSRYSIITICNYETYQNPKNYTNQVDNQEANQQLTNDQPATNQPLTTNNTYNTLKNDKEEKTKYLEFVLLTEKEHQTLVANFGENGTAERIKSLNNYLGAKGDHYKSHYHTIMMWEHKNKVATPKVRSL